MAVLTHGESGDWRREIAVILAVVLLVATAPAFCSPIVADSAPALTVDICHPLQSIGSAASLTNLAGAPSRWTASVPAARTVTRRSKHLLATRLDDSPDTPPPKAAV